jgi:hypothetical protein
LIYDFEPGIFKTGCMMESQWPDFDNATTMMYDQILSFALE